MSRRRLTPYQGFCVALVLSGLAYAGLFVLAIHLFA